MAAVPTPEVPENLDVRDAVNALPEKFRLAVILYYFNGLDIAKASEILGIPPGTVKYRLHRARELLKGRLGDDG
jgi:RNA polymerase sigma-70 factor (ECF subfamily)